MSEQSAAVTGGEPSASGTLPTSLSDDLNRARFRVPTANHRSPIRGRESVDTLLDRIGVLA